MTPDELRALAVKAIATTTAQIKNPSKAGEKMANEAWQEYLDATWPADILELLDMQDKMLEAINESFEDGAWNDYHCGCHKDNNKFWMDGGMSDAECLRRDMGLGQGWHDAETVRSLIPAAVKKRIESALKPKSPIK